MPSTLYQTDMLSAEPLVIDVVPGIDFLSGLRDWSVYLNARTGWLSADEGFLGLINSDMTDKADFLSTSQFQDEEGSFRKLDSWFTESDCSCTPVYIELPTFYPDLAFDGLTGSLDNSQVDERDVDRVAVIYPSAQSWGITVHNFLSAMRQFGTKFLPRPSKRLDDILDRHRTASLGLKSPRRFRAALA